MTEEEFKNKFIECIKSFQDGQARTGMEAFNESLNYVDDITADEDGVIFMMGYYRFCVRKLPVYGIRRLRNFRKYNLFVRNTLSEPVRMGGGDIDTQFETWFDAEIKPSVQIAA